MSLQRRFCTVQFITYQVGEKQKAALGVLFAMNLGSISWMNLFASIDRKSRLEYWNSKELALDGRQSSCVTMIYQTMKPISTIWWS